MKEPLSACLEAAPKRQSVLQDRALSLSYMQAHLKLPLSLVQRRKTTEVSLCVHLSNDFSNDVVAYIEVHDMIYNTIYTTWSLSGHESFLVPIHKQTATNICDTWSNSGQSTKKGLEGCLPYLVKQSKLLTLCAYSM